MQTEAQRNHDILLVERNAIAVYTTHPDNPADARTVIMATGPLEFRASCLRGSGEWPPIEVQQTPPIRTLTCHPQAASVNVRTTRCHAEPIPGGIQIQPAGKNWVGTLAGLCRIGPPEAANSYAALTNWHVAPGTDAAPLVPIHQPYTDRSPIATCDRYAAPRAGQDNYADAAAGSCLVDGKHTLHTAQFLIGKIGNMPIDLIEGASVEKCGRTTGHTAATVTATGAAVRVGYGNFEATFKDQDIITATNTPFSAPGDSGSLIVTSSGLQPAALLYAGGGNVTIACPMRHVTRLLGLQWPVLV